MNASATTGKWMMAVGRRLPGQPMMVRTAPPPMPLPILAGANSPSAPDGAKYLSAKGVPPNFIAEILTKGCPPGRGWLETYVKKGRRFKRYSWRVPGADGKWHKQHVHLGPAGPV